MNQQQQPDLFLPPYAMNAANRSPGSTRPGYNTTTGLPGVARLNQRQMDPAVGQPPAAVFAADDRFGSYDSSAFRHSRMQPSPGFSADFFGNPQAWGYNSGASTVSGAMGDSRLRPGAAARRAAIPTVCCPPASLRFPFLFFFFFFFFSPFQLVLLFVNLCRAEDHHR